MIEFHFHAQFKKRLKKISPQVKEKFFNRLRLFFEDPTNIVLSNHSVGRVYPNCRSINITGDYRAIFYIKDSVVVFVTIGTHAELYG